MHAEENLPLEGRQICQGHMVELSSNAFVTLYIQILGFPGVSLSKESTYNAGYAGSILGREDPPGEGNGNPLQYSCLENSMDRGA